MLARLLPVLVLVVLLAAASPAASVPKGMKANAVHPLAGTWKPNGKGTCWFEFASDGTLKTWHVRDGTTDSEIRWAWEVAPEEAPTRGVKLVRPFPSVPPQRHNCAYELDGDRLRFAFLADQPLPVRLDDLKGLELYDLVRTAR